ncbi:MAG: arsenate reductase ArsC [Pseudomonadota bacterium]
MKKILFLCTGNSCRSQMAEGWAKFLHGDRFEFYSAGTTQHGLNPRAVAVMEEMGIDISGHQSKTVDDIPKEMDVVVTVCSDAHESCPVFPGGKIVHKGFDDPPRLTSQMTNEDDILAVYRTVRDEIKDYIKNIDQWGT